MDPIPLPKKAAAKHGVLARLMQRTGNIAIATGLVAGPLIAFAGALADYLA